MRTAYKSRLTSRYFLFSPPPQDLRQYGHRLEDEVFGVHCRGTAAGRPSERPSCEGPHRLLLRMKIKQAPRGQEVPQKPRSRRRLRGRGSEYPILVVGKFCFCPFATFCASCSLIMSVWYHPVRTRSTAGYIHVPPSTLMTEMGALMFHVYYNV